MVNAMTDVLFFCMLRGFRKAREVWTGVGIYKTDDWNGILDIRKSIGQ